MLLTTAMCHHDTLEGSHALRSQPPPIPWTVCTPANINTEKKHCSFGCVFVPDLLACYFTNHTVKSNARHRSVSSLLNPRPWGVSAWVRVFSCEVWMSSHSALPARSIPPPATSIKAQDPWSNMTKRAMRDVLPFPFHCPHFHSSLFFDVLVQCGCRCKNSERKNGWSCFCKQFPCWLLYLHD